MKTLILMGMLTALLGLPTAEASGLKGVSNTMPNRLSMNVTVARQTQGNTFGEKVASGLQSGANAVAQGIEIGCTGDGCMIAFPDGDGFHADLSTLRLTPLDDAGRQAMQQWSDPHVDSKARNVTQGASLVGGAMPVAGIVSTAVSSVGALSSGGGATSASYAATGRTMLPSNNASGSIDITQPLVDGDYELAVVIEKATSGLKDTLKTNVRATTVPQQVRIVVAFSVRDGALKTRHDTAKNSISNIR